MHRYLSWTSGGLLLGFTFFLATFLVKPIGVSTQYSVTGGLIECQLNPDLVYADAESKSGYASANAYLNKSGGKYAKAVAEPLNYSYLFVLAMVLGGCIGAIQLRLTKKKEPKLKPRLGKPDHHRERWSKSMGWVRYLAAFFGGVVTIVGARMAGGCTSGHMMSGISQTAISGLAFAVVVFVVAIPTARWVYRGKDDGGES